jgi:hypothetical protein
MLVSSAVSITLLLANAAESQDAMVIIPVPTPD